MTCKQPCHESNIGDVTLFNKLYRCFNPLSTTSHNQISSQNINTLVHTHERVCENKGSDHEREIVLNFKRIL